MSQVATPSAAATPRHVLYGVPDGYLPVYLAERARSQTGRAVLHVCSDDQRFDQLSDGLAHFAPDVEVLRFPAWDCLPYDRVSPTADVTGERLKTLTRLAQPRDGKPLIVITTVAAITQRTIPASLLRDASFVARVGDTLDRQRMLDFLVANGYHRSETVREAGEFALRGGLVDIFPSGAPEPLRIDLFGDDIEKIRSFDALSQLTTGDCAQLALYPVSEVMLSDSAITRFRSAYRQLFGAADNDDALYHSISEGRIYAGLEHWLPLYYDRLETLFDYLPDASVTLDHQAEQARDSRHQQAADLYAARQSMMETTQYKPVPLDSLYLPASEWHKALTAHAVVDVSPFAPPPAQADAGARKARDFGDIRAQSTNTNDLYAAIATHLNTLKAEGKQVVIACYSEGSRDRLQGILAEHGVKFDHRIKSEILAIEHGFDSPRLSVLSEQDLLGDRLSRIAKKKKKSDAFMFELSQLHEGDFVVHQEHGIGQFDRLETVVVDGVPHDCIKIIYAGGDKLFVPVENLDVLSRYGSAESGAVLDKLGGAAWQARKARVKRDLLALAQQLLEIAAQRILRTGAPIHVNDNSYEKFAAGFPYPETEDQQKAIDDVLTDLDTDRAMDRLVCGDVGFGKTEVALRAAAMTTLAGYQVAVIAPTTLLARQHYQNFQKRFNGFPVRIGMLSRMVGTREADKVREGIASGDINVLIGTHALLSDKIKFNNLALLVVDEEQKFGVKQKEKLKALKENIHVLTLTATPIPRTLQMALSGVRELSLITTAPIDRLAVKTFVLPFDGVIIRDALMREHYRGGQTYYVCPRISDLEDVREALKEIVPELKVVVAHGQMGAEEIEEKMSAFYEGAFDILLSTTIVESGLDIPNANTMVIHRADMFGLAQLYQLRGRVGRSKQRAYAYLTYEENKRLTKGAEQRLQAIEKLDTLGAGFQLASHDLDIRGAGNLLGEEQSGHIREIGVELYQQMLEEAVAAAKSGAKEFESPDVWAPQINLGMPVVIPENYIADLNLRLSIYRRIAALADRAEIDSFAAELIDRFGPLPRDVENLLDLVEIKQLCRHVGIARIDAGDKGAVMALHPSSRLDIPKLVAYIAKQVGTAKIRPDDQKIVFMRSWDELPQRVKGVYRILTDMAGLL